MAASIAAGHLVKCEKPITIADGLRGRMGDLTWPIIKDFVDEVVTVSEKEIVDAMQLCFERMKVRRREHLLCKMYSSAACGSNSVFDMMGWGHFFVLQLVVEPSGAVGLAAVLSPQFQSSRGRVQGDIKHVGIILSGGNVELACLWDKFLTST